MTIGSPGLAPTGADTTAQLEPTPRQLSVPALPQECHHPLFFIQLTEERQAPLALSFIKVFYESCGAHFAESPARVLGWASCAELPGLHQANRHFAFYVAFPLLAHRIVIGC